MDPAPPCWLANLAALERMPGPEQLARVLRCRIVNRARVSAVHPMAGGACELELEGGVRAGTRRHYAGRIRLLLKG